jgi:hypothetical protein
MAKVEAARQSQLLLSGFGRIANRARLANTLDGAGSARIGPMSPRKMLLFSTNPFGGLQIFANLFLARTHEINRLWAEKMGNCSPPARFGEFDSGIIG